MSKKCAPSSSHYYKYSFSPLASNIPVLCLLLGFSSTTLSCMGFIQNCVRCESYNLGQKTKTVLFQSVQNQSNNNPKPIDPNSWPDKFPAKSHCSRCGLCETSYVTHVSDACAFLGEGMKRNIDGFEKIVHGRRRNFDDIVWNGISTGSKAWAGVNKNGLIADEARFGVMHSPMVLARGKRISGAQWTGCVTSIALSMLESGMVDAVVCIASEENVGKGSAWSSPKPILARSVDDVMRGRGVKPALAPSLNVMDELKKSPEIKKLLFCGVGCAVQAFRAIQNEFSLDEVYVLGTNCADNSPTPEDAREFLRRSVPSVSDEHKRVLGYEFMQDFRVHVKYEDENNATSVSYERIPYFSLPGDVAKFAIADSCLACFDYTNALADVVIGYMGAPLGSDSNMDQSYQTITIRNSRGAKMIENALGACRIELGPVATGSGSHEKIAMATVASDNIVQEMIGGEIKDQGMPRFLGEIMATVMRSIGPTGVSFARYSLDYHLLRNYLHIIEFGGEDGTKMVPEYARIIVEKYLTTNDSFRRLVQSVRSKER